MLLKALGHPPNYAKKRGREGTTKTIRIMKLTGIFLFAAALHVSAATRAQTVTYTAKSTPLAQVFAAIEQQTGYVFFYNSRDLQGARPVTVSLEKTPLKEALERVLSEEPLSFDIQGNTIVITRKVSVDGVNTIKGVPPPPGEIHGHVADTLGNPLMGASVTVKGMHKGAQTDDKGNFTLKGVDNNATLIISFTGFESREIKLNGRSEVTLVMKRGQSQLDETVVKGYYSTTNRLNTGDVSTVKGEEIQEQPVSDPILALEGRVPGLYIAQTSGIPGAYSTVQLRGINSIPNVQGKLATVNNPLYIVDGVPFGSATLTSAYIGGGAVGNPNNSTAIGEAPQGLSPFNNLDPTDIESIEVLKDADATAIYGSRGANGVILITTKKGKAGQTTVDANIYSGSGKVAREMDLLNTSQYLAMRHEAFNNDGLTLGVSDYDINGDWDSTRYTNWQKVLIGNTASFTNAQLNISGGNTNTQFVIGGGYSNQGTVYPGDNHDKKTSAHVNLTHNSIDQRFHLVFSTSYVNDNSDLPNLDLTSYITLAPDAPEIYDANGNLNWQFINGSFTWLNPLRYIVQHDNAITKALVSNLNLDYKLLPGLSLKANIGYTHSQYGQTNLSPSTYWFPPLNANPSFRSIALASAELETWIVEPQAAYRKKMGKGVLDCLVGTTFQQSVSTDMAESASGFASDALISDPVAASNFYIDGNDNTIYRYNALFGRIGYSWGEKYLLNLTGRRDGSSRFGPGKQFGNFGSVGAGWIFSKESFVQNNLGFLSFGKIRASYGSTGNDGIRDYEYLSTYTPASPTYQNASTLSPTQLTNPNFAWETVKKLEGGVDLGFLKDRILLSIGAYRNRTDNQLVGYSLPSITGFTSIQYNLPAVVQNTGTEYTLSTVNIRTAHFSWTSSLNLSFTSNKLVSYPNIQSSTYEFVYAVGKSMFSRLVFHNTGVDPQTGIYTYSTKNANNVPSFPQDLISSQPITQKYFGGIQNSFTFKGFRLEFLFQFVKQMAQNYFSTFNSPGQFNFTSSNEPVEVLNRWQKPGDVTNIAKFSTNSSEDPSYSLGGSDRIFGDASFIRLKNLALSYQLPLDDRRKLHLANARIYINAQNVLTFTKYQGLDPETGGLNLPPLRMLTGGIQLTF